MITQSQTVLREICPPLDETLAAQLIAEFIDVERRFVLGDWEPTTLNGGQFAEVVARVVYHVDSDNLNLRKDLDTCLAYVEDSKSSNSHNFPERRSALHLCRVLRMVYKLRSQRGAVHIDPEYSANELDSMFVVATVRWLMSEILRIFWNGRREAVAQAVREIVRFNVPAIINLDGRDFVLRTDCTVGEEILLLLHNAGERGLTRTELGEAVPRSPSSITNSLKALCSPRYRQVFLLQGGNYLLTPNGQKRVRTELGHKLSLK
ncbi:MAG TPA: hypothetical protein VMD75_07470 [Candidatus Binataceae bacterium]|nr:hypothetical protein [Candidatus Binataceae bacterium]